MATVTCGGDGCSSTFTYTENEDSRVKAAEKGWSVRFNVLRNADIYRCGPCTEKHNKQFQVAYGGGRVNR